MYAPYFEAYLPSSISQVARQSGARYLTLAFIQTPRKGSCTATWNGDAKEPLSAGHYLAQIAALRAMGGDVIPSFGGYSADHGGTELADSCTSVSKIAAAYELLVSKYHVTRLDMDVEDRSLNNSAGINRRNEAIAMAQAWAAARGITLQVDFTIPVEPYGLDPNGLNVVKNAIANHVHITVVNIMTFDYYQTHEGRVDMPAAAMAAALNLHNQLAGLYPRDTARQLWQMEGMTLLPGIDDRGKIETTYVRGTGRGAGLRPPLAHGPAVDLGDPARQRRLPRRDRQQHLLGDQAADLGLQPPAGAVHVIGFGPARAGPGSGRAAGDTSRPRAGSGGKDHGGHSVTPEPGQAASHAAAAAQIERAYPGYRVWVSDEGWWYATRTRARMPGQSATVHGPGPGGSPGRWPRKKAPPPAARWRPPGSAYPLSDAGGACPDGSRPDPLAFPCRTGAWPFETGGLAVAVAAAGRGRPASPGLS